MEWAIRFLSATVGFTRHQQSKQVWIRVIILHDRASPCATAKFSFPFSFFPLKEFPSFSLLYIVYLTIHSEPVASGG